MKIFRSFFTDDGGQGLVEYALIIALIAVVAITALSLLGTSSNNKLNAAANGLN